MITFCMEVIIRTVNIIYFIVSMQQLQFLHDTPSVCYIVDLESIFVGANLVIWNI